MRHHCQKANRYVQVAQTSQFLIMTTTETLQLLYLGIVSLSTVVYSVLTWKLVSETRRMREFQITPDVNIFFERAEAEKRMQVLYI